MAHDTQRPPLDIADARSEAESAVAGLIAQLQGGLDNADADVYDSWFGDDIRWGGPYGGVVTGYAELNRIHHELMARRVAPASQFEVLSTIAPAPATVVTHIRRRALDDNGFSETAMYVLVNRDGRWWLAAAQNTAESRK